MSRHRAPGGRAYSGGLGAEFYGTAAGRAGAAKARRLNTIKRAARIEDQVDRSLRRAHEARKGYGRRFW